MYIILVNCLGMFELTEKLAVEVELSSPISDPSVFVLQGPLSREGLPPRLCDREGREQQTSTIRAL